MPAKRSNRVYVVDDHPVISATLAAILSRAGYQAIAFDASQRAIDAARLFTPDLLISNIAMPGLTGIELAIRFKNQFPLCKILLFSGQAQSADLLIQAQKAGYDFSVLSKPVYPKDILDRLCSLQTD
jgi:CheY-like chemotaxis protein